MPNRTASRVAVLAVELSAGSPPTEFRLLPAGRFKSTDGTGRPVGVSQGWLLDDVSASRLIAAAAARASDYVIDFEHQTLHAAKNGQPAPAAGWFRQLEWRADGLYAIGVRWTERASALIAAGEYRYVSPVFSYATDGRVLALGPAALVNNPALDGLTDLSRAALAALFAEEAAPMKELMKAIGLAETATEAEALVALSALKSAHGTEVAALKGAAPDPAKYVPLEQHAQVQNELAALVAKVDAAERDGLMTAALADGRVLPAQEVYWRAQPLAALKSYLEVAHPLAAMTGSQTGGKPPEGGGNSNLSPAQLAVCSQMGIAPEDYAKTLAADSAA